MRDKAIEILNSIKEVCEQCECDECPFSIVKNECCFETGFFKPPCDWEIKTVEKITVD